MEGFSELWKVCGVEGLFRAEGLGRRMEGSWGSTPSTEPISLSMIIHQALDSRP